MPGYLRRGADWWFEGTDGSWVRWNAETQRWEPDVPPPPAPGEAPTPGWSVYRSVAPLWTVVAGLLALATIIDAAAAVSDLAEIDLLNRIARGEFVSEAEALASDRRQGLFGLLQTLALLVAGIPFIVWLFRAYSNLPTLGIHGLRFRRWWTIGGWFIPIWGLFRPKQLVNDVWRGSDPAGPAGKDWRQGPVPGWWLVWWLAFLVSNWLAVVAFRLSFSAETLEPIRQSSFAYLISDAISVGAGILAILIVREASQRQLARARALGIAAPSGRPGGAARR